MKISQKNKKKTNHLKKKLISIKFLTENIVMKINNKLKNV